MRCYDIPIPAQGGQTTCPMQSRELHIESRPFFVRYWIVATALFVIIAVGLSLPKIRLITQIREGIANLRRWMKSASLSRRNPLTPRRCPRLLSATPWHPETSTIFTCSPRGSARSFITPQCVGLSVTPLGHGVTMVDFRPSDGTFLSWRTIATNFKKGMGWALQYRRNSKTDSALKLDGEPRPDSTGFLHISESDTQGVHALPTYGSQQHSPGSEPTGPTLPGANNREIDEGQGDGQEDHTVPTANQGNDSRNAREAEILKIYKRLDNFSALRVHARQSRMELSYKREDEMKLRVELMKRLNAFFANLDHPEAGPIMQEYELLQTAAEEYVKMENSYREEEDQLEEQEYHLSVSMEDLSVSFNKGEAPDFQTYTRISSPSTGKEEGSTDETPSCILTYLAGIAQERMLQEQLADLESEWYMANEKQAQRQRLDLALDQESADFLRTFAEEHNKTWKDLNNTQMDVNAFRMICLEQDHRDFVYQNLSSLHFYHPYVGENTWEPEPNPLKLPPQEQAVFPEHTGASPLGNNDYWDLENDIPEITPSSQHQFNQALQQKSSISSNEYMNKWMLHQLRISSVGIWRLTHSPLWNPLREQGWQDQDIGQAVLDSWFSDETALAPSSYSPHLHNNDEGDDTVVGHATGYKTGVVVRAQSLPSPPSSPRASAPKVGSMRPRSRP